MRSSTVFRVAVACAAFLGPRVSHGDGPCEVAKLTGDPGFGSSFGLSLAISGDYIVAGDASDSTKGSTAGAAYIFHRAAGRWEREAKIFGSGTDFMDVFGFSVAVEGDRVVVGAPHYDPAGSQWWGYAFVFQRVDQTWVEQQKLISSQSALDDRFGWSVAISGDWIAVGAPWQDDYFGRVFLFRWDGNSFIEEASIFGPHLEQFEQFGTAIALDQDRLIVGYQAADERRGKAYVFRRDGVSWLEEAQLTASDAAPNDLFGYAVSLSGDFAIVAGPGTDHTGLGAGSAYIFHRTGMIWTEQANLHGSNPQAGAEFGTSVRIRAPYALVGAPGHDIGGTDDNTGATFLFQYVSGAWSEVTPFVPNNADPGIVFGVAMGFDGVSAVIGASSSAYVFAVPNGPPCIPVMSFIGVCILAGVLVIAGVALLGRSNLNVTHYDDS